MLEVVNATREEISNTTKFKYSLYNVKLVDDASDFHDYFVSFFQVSEVIIYTFLISIIYLFVALEEADHQILSASGAFIESEEAFDEWSLWSLFRHKSDIDYT